jgi:hypothetical protein
MKKKPTLAQKFIELRDDLQGVCVEIAAEVNYHHPKGHGLPTPMTNQHTIIESLDFNDHFL